MSCLLVKSKEIFSENVYNGQLDLGFGLAPDIQVLLFLLETIFFYEKNLLKDLVPVSMFRGS